MEDLETLRKEILAYRKEHNLSQKAFGAKCGLSRFAILKIENGRGRIRDSTILKIKSGMED